MATTRIVDIDSLFVQIAAHSFYSEFCTHKLKGICLCMHSKTYLQHLSSSLIIMRAFIRLIIILMNNETRTKHINCVVCLEWNGSQIDPNEET